MRAIPRKPIPLLALLLVPVLLAGAREIHAQERADIVEAYHQALADHFRIPADEVAILSEWDLGRDELPVLLFLARHGGISADALVTMRRSGRSWSERASRYGVGPAAAYISPADGSLPDAAAATYARFDDLPPSRWNEVGLQDSEWVLLVNVRVLSDVLDVRPGTVLQAWDRGGSFVGAYGALLRR